LHCDRFHARDLSESIMTEEQFEKLMAIQVAQLAMFQGIYSNLTVIAASGGKATAHNWGEVETLLKTATAQVRKL